ncbi:DedA family protein [Simplicispira psychrophila]|uniref:DedA family protein n=1 Tax=Simplicispira psychrophila TaxID=80882 RepID=UPI00056D8D50|nr:DedA family protein [Simplicispira psychrophila]
MQAAHIAEWVQSYGYVAVAVGTFLEGESVLLVAGAAASRGHLSMSVVVAVAAFASFLGDQLYFWIGRHYGTALLVRYPSLEPRAARVRGLLDRHYLPVILSLRFLYGLRIAGPIAIGMSSVSWPQFLLLNGLAAVLWALLIAGAGYGTGHALVYLLKAVDADELWGLSLLLIVGLVWWLLARRRALNNKS